jgi:phage recombination protein Bet
MTQAIERVDLPDLPARRTSASNLAQVTGFNDRIIQLVKATVAPGATPLELACFLYNAKRLGLDPITRQIYFIKYSKDLPGEIVVGINGYRAQAESSGVYAGSDDAEFEYEDVGQPKGLGAPSKATVTVWKIVAGQRVPFTASARWKEFYPGEGKQGEQYRKRPHNQLAIRAESHALRKGFPQQTERLEIQEAPVEWEQAALADERARDDPQKIARDSRRYAEIFGGEDDRTRTPVAAHTRRARASSATPAATPAPASDDDEQAQAIVDQAHAAAAQRDEDLDAIARAEWEQEEEARQKASEGLL